MLGKLHYARLRSRLERAYDVSVLALVAKVANKTE